MALARRLSLRVPGNASGIHRAIDAFTAFITRHGIDLPAPWQVELALDEMLSNIVTHAYDGRADEVIRITFAVVAGEFRVTIADNGRPFDPLAMPEPDTHSPLEARPTGGLGIHLVRKLMDRVEYSRTAGCNRLVLGRRLPQRLRRKARNLGSSS